MDRFREGDIIKGGCKNCKKVVSATLMRRSFPIENGLGLVENALLAICDECDEVIGIPSQSTTAVRKALDKMNGEIHQVTESNSQIRCNLPRKSKSLISKKIEPSNLNINALKSGNLRITTC